MAQIANARTLFHLLPLNGTAREALDHPDNRRFVSPAPNRKLGLEVGFHVASAPGRVMARLGRDADLILKQRNVSAVHISFEIHPETLVVLLSARTKRTRSVLVEIDDTGAEETTSDESADTPGGDPVDTVEGDCVLSYGQKYKIDVAGYRFLLLWCTMEPTSLREFAIQEYRTALERQAHVRSRHLPTEADSEAHTWHNTRMHTAQRPLFQETKSVPRVLISAGQFGEVYQVVDDLTGNCYAVKVLLLHKLPSPEIARAMAHREFKALQRLKHRNIVELLGYAKFDTDKPEIFMPLRLGSLTKLAKGRNKEELSDENLSTMVLEQMLSALDCLAFHSMCHRDVKPDNIIYYWVHSENKELPGEKMYVFQLADFGLANYRHLAVTSCGTTYYKAPELEYHTAAQSPKLDVWALFATIAEIHSMFEFPPTKAKTYEDVLLAIRAAALKVPNLAPMVRENPDHRASAAQILMAHFNGRGLTTPKAKVTPILDEPPVQQSAPAPRLAPAPAQTPASSSLVKYPPRRRRQPSQRDAARVASRPLGGVGITKPRARGASSTGLLRPERVLLGRGDAAQSRPHPGRQAQQPPQFAFLGGGIPNPTSPATPGLGAQTSGWAPVPENSLMDEVIQPGPAQTPGLAPVPENSLMDEVIQPGPAQARLPGSFPNEVDEFLTTVWRKGSKD